MTPHSSIRLCFSLCLLLVSGCKDITHVQTGYVADRDECRGRSESNVGVYSQPDAYPMSDKERGTALLQLFCECMKEKDWKVAGCPKPPAAVAATPAPAQAAPTFVVVQSPTAQPALLPTPAAAPAPAHAAKKKKTKVCQPPTVCPAPADATNGTYQPTTPTQSDQQLQKILQQQ